MQAASLQAVDSRSATGSGPPVIEPWIQSAKLTATDGAPSDTFGFAVAMEGDTALVAARGAAVAGNSHQGVVYVYVRENDEWVEQARLTASDGEAFDAFGTALALHGDLAVIGAMGADVGSNAYQGVAYVFSRVGTEWSEQAKLISGDGQGDDAFGQSVALYGDVAMIGAPGATVDGNANRGAAYIFGRDNGEWSERTKLVASDGAASDAFGRSVALHAEFALASAWRAPVDGNTRQGAAYVFHRDGNAWSEQAKLVASDGTANDVLGISAALSNDTALVGAFGSTVDGNIDQGAAYVFRRKGSTWEQEAKLTADDGVIGDNFGRSVALSGDSAVIGAVSAHNNQGAAYIFGRDGGSWEQRARLAADDGDAGGTFVSFGLAAALSGDTALIGASSADVGGNVNQGAAYVFTLAEHFAIVQGNIRSLHCADHAVLPDASVVVTSQHDSYTVIANENGFYHMLLDEAEGPIHIAVSADGHSPSEVLDVEIIGGELVVQDFDLVLDAPCASVQPAQLTFEVSPDQIDGAVLTIDNTAGTTELQWALATAVPAQAGFSGVHPDCEDEPGLIIHDDGTVERVYSGNAAMVTEMTFVDYFTPAAYPSTMRAVCVAWATDGPTSLDFEVVVLADDGPDDSPGTELGSLAATATGIPPYPISTPTWVRVDISDLGITLDSGGVFIGVRWSPSTPNIWIAADESPENPVGFAGGYWWNDHDDVWTPLQDPVIGFPGYRSLFIRAVEDPAGCFEPSDVPWLNFEPGTGSVSAGLSSEPQVTVDSSNLVAGEYRASICINSNDPARPLLVVPVSLIVSPPSEDGIYSDRFE